MSFGVVMPKNTRGVSVTPQLQALPHALERAFPTRPLGARVETLSFRFVVIFEVGQQLSARKLSDQFGCSVGYVV